MSITSLQSVPPTCGPDGTAPAIGFVVPALRRTRQDVVAELSRCRYLLRLVRARTDLLVASVLGPLDEVRVDRGPWNATDTPAPTADEISRLVLDVPARGVGEQLEALTDAGRRLAAHESRLHGRLDDVTGDLVRALTADSGAALRTPPRR